jgi:hypothetical protein
LNTWRGLVRREILLKLARFDTISLLRGRGRQFTSFELLGSLHKRTGRDSSQAKSFHSIRERIDVKSFTVLDRGGTVVVVIVGDI